MTKGLDIRAQVDTETVKGLLLINGGGAVALLAFLSTIFGKPNLGPLTTAVLWALFTFQLGLIAAVVHNHLRRKCSLKYESHDYRPPRCKFIPTWISDDPCVCVASICFMWLSLTTFIAGGLLVLDGGLKVISHTDSKQDVSCWHLQEIPKGVYKINQCTGVFERIELNPTTPNKPLKRE